MSTTFSLPFLLILTITLTCEFSTQIAASFSIKEATIDDIQLAFHQNKLTTTQLVNFYLQQIHRLNPLLRAVIELNPDARYLAEKADRERKAKAHRTLPSLHGIPVLLKDNIATKDKLNTTAGSYALVGSVVPRDAGVVGKLRRAGAIILGKASMTEWAAFRSSFLPSGYCGRTGQGKNPYVLSADPCGSSSGSGISVAANLVAVSLGTETDGSILCPSSANSVVGIKPTVGLTSRGGVVPISPRQDTVGPMCRTVRDAVYVLDAIVGFDYYDKATRAAARFIPKGGYKQFLKRDGLKGKRLGIVRNPFFTFGNDQGSVVARAFKRHIYTLRRKGAIVIDHLEISNITEIVNGYESGEQFALLAEFKPAINAYLKQLVKSPVRSLADLIAFNKRFANLEKTKDYGQDIFESAESMNKTNADKILKLALPNLNVLSRNGLEKLVRKRNLDALVSPFDIVRSSSFSSLLAIGGYPGISVPAGYDSKGVPFGICFGGVKGSEPKLIEIAYGFEQATKIRKAPLFKS
ncbi:probable amidase At4g34880 [Mercurialis annua]|uniref:probable amidase At4g34880 n=1 Tax=Mercurialis annua TaxID=3986 RepID=UPI00215FF4EC|nr:probable amidase At4g34880 [Mercurialis annua]